MTGTYTGQFVMCGFLELRIKPWQVSRGWQQAVAVRFVSWSAPLLTCCFGPSSQRTFVTRGVALLPTLAVALACRSPTALDTLTQALNVLQSVQLPFALIPVTDWQPGLPV